MSRHRIAVIPGDGIGVEVVREAVETMSLAASAFGIALDVSEWDLGAERYLRTGTTITEEDFRSLADEHDAILLGALGDPRVPDGVHARDILLGLRFRLDLYVNFRPCVLLDPALSPLKSAAAGSVHVEIFRENTEGLYVDMGGIFKKGTPDEIAIQEDVNTRKGVERIIRAAFQHARAHGRPRVTLVDKANAMPAPGSLWRRTFDEVGEGFPEISRDAMYVDAMVMDLVRRPESYSVLVCPNLFGDIVSDLAAAVTGGLGAAPSANIHPGRHALFEPVHGSAPDIAGTDRANPLGAIRCLPLLFEHLGLPGAARTVDEAVLRAIRAGETTTDMGGSLGTAAAGRAVRAHLEKVVGEPPPGA